MSEQNFNADWVNRRIREAFPDGTNPYTGQSGWDHFPIWPPDLFGICAFLLQQSGQYAHPTFTAHQNLYSEDESRALIRLGEEWRERGKLALKKLAKLRGLWRRLCRGDQDWIEAAGLLLAIADEAAGGVGFPGENWLTRIVEEEYSSGLEGRPRQLLHHLPYSLCAAVSPERFSVLPKTVTPQTGCSIRNFSHHLSLLPGGHEVAAMWWLGPSYPDRVYPLNLMLIPFPYRVDEDCFSAGAECTDHSSPHSFFALEQKWLKDVTVEKFFYLVNGLMEKAKDAGLEIHGVLLPELALSHSENESESLVVGLATKLAQKFPRLEIFCSGFAQRLEDSEFNGLFTAICQDGAIQYHRTQYKHHRWCLDETQIIGNRLDSSLNPKRIYWEPMEILPREVNFYQFRPGACFTTLICEDLARLEPVQQTIRSVGASLVLCFLMDGAQLDTRWSSRCAMTLASDPGSSVMTLTSTGMISRHEKGVAPWRIGLWGQANDKPIPLELPSGAHALVATLWSSDTSQYTIDGRSDNGCTPQFSLSGTRALVHPDPPSWL